MLIFFFSSAQIGHFTAMVNDKQTHIGCALINYRQGWFRTCHLACNYSYTNIIGKPVYVAGSVASGCQSGKNNAFSGLCSLKENIIPA